MKKFFVFLLTAFAIHSCGQQKKADNAEKEISFYVDPKTNSDDMEVRMAYGLNITPPWDDGGYFFVNLPEHFWFMPDTKGIARHHDKRNNVWQVSKDGKEAGYDVESILAPGIRLAVKAKAEKDRVNFEMTVTNNSDSMIKSIGSLFCFQYHHLKGFPLRLSNNFDHTYIVLDGKPVLLKDIKVDSADAVARMAQVKGCKDEHNWWAEKMGGMIEQRMDNAITALTSLSDDRKVILSWNPGKSMLSNKFIPCIHADPCIGDLAKGESRTINGTLIFTRNSLESVISELTNHPITMTEKK